MSSRVLLPLCIKCYRIIIEKYTIHLSLGPHYPLNSHVSKPWNRHKIPWLNYKLGNPMVYMDRFYRFILYYNIMMNLLHYQHLLSINHSFWFMNPIIIRITFWINFLSETNKKRWFFIDGTSPNWIILDSQPTKQLCPSPGLGCGPKLGYLCDEAGLQPGLRVGAAGDFRGPGMEVFWSTAGEMGDLPILLGRYGKMKFELGRSWDDVL